ncbi:MAG: MBOAT family protein [Methyloprofundus sp.]|nr:MBOAT family protein [Methyloprofundus sp.]
MIFSSSSFILFLFALLGVYSNCKTPVQRANVLLIASFIFYASWKPIYLILLLLSLVFNYYIYIRLIERASKILLTLGVVANLFLLGIFKYAVLIIETWIWVNFELGIEGIQALPSWLDWALPLGISFFTFQMLSALIDVYRGEWDERITFRQWCLYVSFFPQFIAGPIARASELVDQLQVLHPLKWVDLRAGALIFAGGLIKKALFADNLAPLVETLYSQPGNLDFTTAWIATLAFALQIYFDFSGYSEMAIGLGRMFGIRLPRNFKHPYISKSCAEFWHRWHMTLSRWLRDYLFIPLGGSRCSNNRTSINLLLTMVLGGLWHGAGWNFVFWGFLHGTYLIGHRVLKSFYSAIDLNSKFIFHQVVEFLSRPFTFLLICFTWVFFRAENFSGAWAISSAMLGFYQGSHSPPEIRLYLQFIVLFSFVFVLLEPLIERWFLKGFRQWRSVPFYVRGTAYASIAMAVHVFGGSTQKFIYFDF